MKTRNNKSISEQSGHNRKHKAGILGPKEQSIQYISIGQYIQRVINH